jgi:Fic family protein
MLYHVTVVADANPASSPSGIGHTRAMNSGELSPVPAGGAAACARMTDALRGNRTRWHRGEQQTVNMLRVLEIIRQQADIPGWLLTENCIKEFNRMVLDGIPEESYSAGDYKRRKNYLLDGRRRVVFSPPLPGECPPLVAELVQTVNRWIRERRAGSQVAPHPVRIAAIACSRLIAIHPFAQGNGRTARAVATMTLATFRYTPLPSDDDDKDAFPVKTLEWYFGQHLPDYYAGLSAARRGNWPIWIDIFDEAVQATMKGPLSAAYWVG